MNEMLDEFGKIFVKDVRDRTIADIDMLISGKYRSERAKKISCMFEDLNLSAKSFTNNIIPIIVDYCLHNMMEMFEQHEEIELKMEGENLTQISDGLAGELYTEDGWIQKYTKERYEED